MRWLAPLQIAYFTAFFMAAVAFRMGLPAAAIGLGCIVVLAGLSIAELRCPRCGLGLHRRHAERKLFVSVDALPMDCPKCGRSRRSVYPFQRLLKPERN